ncbi:hypothetical protein [Methylobacterium durans]|uniref:Uncharacterized protein n=1 Tax=Methylobacterium durans TaxID=2202825 RepID=A0A2U8WDR8_9HYPH|nr:hypothetical protein [Methylobacterium durans]AWN43658.1 hypothetical protein DK389_28050 [Methylobacterium durans]
MSETAASRPTVLELLDRGLLRPEAVARLADNYLAAPGLRTHAHTLSLGLVLDVAAAIQAYPLAGAILASALVSPRVKRSAVGTAILLARPQKV